MNITPKATREAITALPFFVFAPSFLLNHELHQQKQRQLDGFLLNKSAEEERGGRAPGVRSGCRLSGAEP